MHSTQTCWPPGCVGRTPGGWGQMTKGTRSPSPWCSRGKESISRGRGAACGHLQNSRAGRGWGPPRRRSAVGWEGLLISDRGEVAPRSEQAVHGLHAANHTPLLGASSTACSSPPSPDPPRLPHSSALKAPPRPGLGGFALLLSTHKMSLQVGCTVSRTYF